MADELQGLLTRIQQEGVNKAEAEAAKIIETARREAARIIGEAEQQAVARRQKAEEDAAQFMQRGESALQQAARDVVLTVQDSVFRLIQGLAEHQVKAALTPQFMEQLLAEVVRAYFSKPGAQAKVDLLVSKDQVDQLTARLAAAFREAAQSGLTIQADSGVSAGFKVRLVGDRIQHDFTSASVAEALGRLVRPQLAAIVRQGICRTLPQAKSADS